MIFFTKSKVNKFQFCFQSPIQKQTNFIMPVYNGGIKTIDKNIINLYANAKLSVAKQTITQGNQLVRSVKAFKNDVQQDPVLRMSLQAGLKSIKKGGILQNTSTKDFFHTLSNLCTQPPKFEDERIVGVPFLSLFIDLIDTKHGQFFFGSKLVNQHLKEIFNNYNIMLSSKISLQYMKEQEPNGWFCKTALKYIDYNQYYVDKNKPHWGFKSWNDWFTRSIRPEFRPIDQRPNSIVHSSDSYPLYYRPGQLGMNPFKSLKTQDKFWLKDNLYSLYDTLGARKMGITKFIDDHFVGGTVYQAFLDPWCYHRWHSLVSGTIVKSYFLQGTYYLSNPGLQNLPEKTDVSKYLLSMPMLSAVSTRQVIIIRLDDDSDRYVAIIEIGMAQVSSCRPIVIQGEKVEKGQQLGRFEFGGSSYAVIFDKKFNLTFNPSISVFNQSNQSSNKQFVNSWLALYDN